MISFETERLETENYFPLRIRSSERLILIHSMYINTIHTNTSTVSTILKENFFYFNVDYFNIRYR